MLLGRELLVQDVRFRYPGTAEDVLSEVSLRIPAGGSFALVGASGAGKSTLLDLVLGLHQMQEGDLVVDGESVLARLPDWQRSIGLVPQDVFLLDDTIAANVAFGVPPAAIDRDRVQQSLERAQLKDFVENLPAGPETIVGERGARISGGQRQRIGIARALYIEPELLVLDEATSALDNETEARIAQTITALSGELTILVVAHRLSTIRNCDEIAFIEHGQITATGTFDGLRLTSPAFARLVSLGELN